MSQKAERSFVETLLEYSVPLIAGVIAALIFANVDNDAYTALIHFSPFGHEGTLAHVTSIHFLVNDVFMAFFFGMATKEIVEACLPGGALNPVRRAMSPLLGTLGGVLGPIVVYLTWVTITGDQTIANGWGIPTATDIALAWLIARVVFGATHPAVSFLLLLAVADDGIGLGIIAIFYPDPLHPVRPVFLLMVAAAALLAYGMKKKNIQSFVPYLLGPGVISWLGLYLGHLHPALALVPILPFLPHEAKDEGLFAEQRAGHPKHTDALNRFADFFHAPIGFGLFFFGLANAGVPMASVGNATWGIFLALLIGKTGGIFLVTYLGTKVGIELPAGMNLRSLFTAAVTAGLGLTVALFVAGVAFTDPGLQGAAKMGALMSALIAPLAIVVGRLLRADRFEEPRVDEGGEPHPGAI